MKVKNETLTKTQNIALGDIIQSGASYWIVVKVNSQCALLNMNTMIVSDFEDDLQTLADHAIDVDDIIHNGDDVTMVIK